MYNWVTEIRSWFPHGKRLYSISKSPIFFAARPAVAPKALCLTGVFGFRLPAMGQGRAIS